MAIKQQRKLTIIVSLKIVFSYRSSFRDLPVALADFQLKVSKSRFHHVYQGEYVAMHEINLDRVELKICWDCVDKLWIGGKPVRLKKVQHITVYSMDELG